MNILITGGLGFIGTNAAIYFANRGHSITIVDNKSRKGVELNEQLLRKSIKNLNVIHESITSINSYKESIEKAHVILHLAGQTAVTISIIDPLLDFTSNVQGTFMLLEAVRTHNPKAIVLYSSTNKVYGDLSHYNYTKDDEKQWYVPEPAIQYGIGENEQLNFISPYGCSKGSADMYMLDYARMYGLNTVVFRQSCIYGPFQMGVEDQGWVAHFSKQFLKKEPITIYGDGYQVRDLLFVEDLVEAYQLAIKNINTVKGTAFNIGGGTNNAFSLLQVLKILENELGYAVPIHFSHSRGGDQQYFCSQNQLVKEALSWSPKTSFINGVTSLLSWQQKNII